MFECDLSEMHSLASFAACKCGSTSVADRFLRFTVRIMRFSWSSRPNYDTRLHDKSSQQFRSIQMRVESSPYLL